MCEWRIPPSSEQWNRETWSMWFFGEHYGIGGAWNNVRLAWSQASEDVRQRFRVRADQQAGSSA